MKMAMLIKNDIMRKVMRLSITKFSEIHLLRMISNRYKINPVLVRKKIIFFMYDQASDLHLMFDW